MCVYTNIIIEIFLSVTKIKYLSSSSTSGFFDSSLFSTLFVFFSSISSLKMINNLKTGEKLYIYYSWRNNLYRNLQSNFDQISLYLDHERHIVVCSKHFISMNFGDFNDFKDMKWKFYIINIYMFMHKSVTPCSIKLF